MKKSFLMLLCFAIMLQSYAQIAQWRGENRDGKYNNETELLKEWPEDGPKLLWHFDNLGPGHSSAMVTDEKIYTVGTDKKEKTGFVIALNHKGKEEWRTEYGEEWFKDWDGSRSSPLVYNDKVYMMSSFGIVICLNADDGKEIWKVDLFKEYGGVNIQWGVTESLAFDGEKIFVTIGGVDANVIALNKDNGELIWKCKGKSEASAYCSPLIIEHGGRKMLVTMTAEHTLGIEVSSGELLWDFEHINQYAVHSNTPVYKDGYLYLVSGYKKGCVMLEIAEDGNSVKKIWSNKDMDNKLGGVVEVDGKIYGSSGGKNVWYCLDWKTGDVVYTSKKIINRGNIIYADGLLYCYGQDGKIALVEPTDTEFNTISTFKIEYGERQHWAHISIHNKKLYVRHGTSLMVYDISK